eukprot:PhF_6_TR37903/c0_g1_i1/m.56601
MGCGASRQQQQTTQSIDTYQPSTSGNTKQSNVQASSPSEHASVATKKTNGTSNQPYSTFTATYVADHVDSWLGASLMRAANAPGSPRGTPQSSPQSSPRGPAPSSPRVPQTPSSPRVPQSSPRGGPAPPPAPIEFDVLNSIPAIGRKIIMSIANGEEPMLDSEYYVHVEVLPIVDDVSLEANTRSYSLRMNFCEMWCRGMSQCNSPIDVEWWCATLCMFRNLPGSVSDNTVKRIADGIRHKVHFFTSAHAVRWCCEVIGLFTVSGNGGNVDGRRDTFSTETFVDVFDSMGRYSYGHNMALQQYGRALCNLTSGGGNVDTRTERYASASMSHKLMEASKCVGTPESAQWIAGAISSLCGGVVGVERRSGLFAVNAMHDGIIFMSKVATTSLAVQWVSSVVVSVCGQVSMEERIPIFATPELCNALLSMHSFAFTNESVRWLAAAIATIAQVYPSLFTEHRKDTPDILATIAYKTTDAEAARWVAGAMCNITCGDGDLDARCELFATEKIRDALTYMALKCVGEDCESAQWVSGAVCTITAAQPTRLAVFKATPALVDALRKVDTNLQHHQTSPGAKITKSAIMLLSQ